MISERRFRFLNEEHDIGTNGWDDPSVEKLWRYNLHYFDDLNSFDSSARTRWHADLTEAWVADNPPGRGSGWEPYPTSLRIVNWVKWHLGGHELSATCRQSLAIQVRCLRSRLEWHLLGNHLFANAKALVFAGLFFEGAEADRWLAQGLDIIATQLPEQVLTDGGNFERSPMYHALFLEDVLDLINAGSAYVDRVPDCAIQAWRDTAQTMLGWLDLMCHPDGEIGLFNDAAIGVAPSPAALRDYAARLCIDASSTRPCYPLSMTLLSPSGYARVADERYGMVALLDVAPVGPDYLPGHAHADTLSFEMSIFGRRFIVNGGTSRYGLGPQRLLERGTAAHSTVVVNGEDSSEVWSGFRVARRARPFDLSAIANQDFVTVGCSHDGYRRLSGKPIHRREWRFTVGKAEIRDLVSGRFLTAESHLHFHPDVLVTQAGADQLVLEAGDNQRVKLTVRRGTLSVGRSTYAASFGQPQATKRATIGLLDGFALVELDWT